MENHSYESPIDQLWNSTAMVRVHSYGIPEQVQTDSGVECTHRFPAARRIQSGPGTCALFAQFLYDRSIARTGMRMAELQRTIDDFLIKYKKTPSALIAGSLGAA
jgi:hypothetical protein